MEARRQKILDAATDIIAREGVDAFSMRGLGKEVGLSVTTLYNLYGSKEAIIDALQDRTLLSIEAVLQALPDEFDPIEQARMVMAYSAEQCVKGKSLTRALWQGNWQQCETSERSMEFFARGAGMQEVALSKAIEKGVLRPGFKADIMASQLFIGWEGVARFWAQETISDDEFIARVVHLLVVSIMPFANGPLRQELEKEMQQLETRLTPFRRVRGDAISETA